jgi:hypothetical protein
MSATKKPSTTSTPTTEPVFSIISAAELKKQNSQYAEKAYKSTVHLISGSIHLAPRQVFFTVDVKLFSEERADGEAALAKIHKAINQALIDAECAPAANTGRKTTVTNTATAEHENTWQMWRQFDIEAYEAWRKEQAAKK